MAAQRGVADQPELVAQRLVERRAPFGAVETAPLCLALPEQVDHRHGLVQKRLHGARAALVQQVVGVLARRHDGEAQRVSRLQQRQRQVDQPVSGAQAGVIAIERHHRFARDAPEQLQLRLGDRGAKRRQRGGEPRLDQRDDVHVALGDDERGALAGRLARGAVVVERPPLVEKQRLGAVDVLGVVGRVHRPATEGDAVPARVADREHDAVAEGVVVPIPRLRGLGQPAIEDQILGHPGRFQVIPEPLPAIGGEADLEPLLRTLVQPAPGKVFARLRTGVACSCRRKWRTAFSMTSTS